MLVLSSSIVVFSLLGLMMTRTCICLLAMPASSTTRMQFQGNVRHGNHPSGNVYRCTRKIDTKREKWRIRMTSPPDVSNSSDDDIFGSEFRGSSTSSPLTSSDTSISSSSSTSTTSSPPLNAVRDPEDVSFYLKKNRDGIGYKTEMKRKLKPEERAQIMRGYDQMRASFIEDSIFVSVIGLSVVLWFGTFKDAISFGIGAILGGFYAVLLSSYVEKLGNNERNTTGNLRFAPVILLIAIYSRNKDVVNIIPELLGFSCYQIGSLLQAFNENAYGYDESIATSTSRDNPSAGQEP